MSKKSAASSSSRSSVSLIVGWCVGILVVGLLFCFSVFQYGIVTGEEFSPDTFNRRNYFYYEVPFFRIQIWPISTKNITGDLEKNLVSKKIIKPINQSKPKWDLVYESHGSTVVDSRDAAILTDYFNYSNGRWLDWTNKHPKIGKLLWPAVADLSRQELYFFIPELIELASNSDDDAEFQTKLSSFLGENFTLLAGNQQKLKAHQAVVELTKMGLKFDPANEDLKRLRETSLKALGKSADAKSEATDAKESASGHS